MVVWSLAIEVMGENRKGVGAYDGYFGVIGEVRRFEAP
jgi:hypothetical protein